LYVQADKTTNVYKVRAEDHNTLPRKNVAATCKKTEGAVKAINKEAKTITNKLDLQDKIECYSRSPAFSTLKEHKPNFTDNPKCRLINPAKTQIGKVSKVELDKINNIFRSSTEVNQWRNTSGVLDWFQGLLDKNKSRFLKFDIIDFYPSIT